jgi:cytochrome c553
MVTGLVATAGQVVNVGEKAPLDPAKKFQGPAALLFVSECDSVPKLPEITVAVVGDLACEKEVRRLADPKGQLAKSFGITPGQRAAVLIDGNGFVRRMIRRGSDGAFATAVQADVKAWIHGQAIYDSQCARCHGADGLDTTYQGSKSLGGLGRRTNEAGILELTERTGVVDLSGLTAEQRRALAVYVAGL